MTKLNNSGDVPLQKEVTVQIDGWHDDEALLLFGNLAMSSVLVERKQERRDGNGSVREVSAHD